jgi:hypothetical protein
LFSIYLSSFFQLPIRRKRWDTGGSVESGHAEYARSGLLRTLALEAGRKHAEKKSAKENGMPRNVLSGIKRTVHIFRLFT